MDIQKLFKNTLIDFLETLDKELRLSICIDKIYFNTNFKPELLSEKIYNLIKNNYDDEIDENSTMVINKSGEKFLDAERIIRFIKDEPNIKNKCKIKKAIKKFENMFFIKYDYFNRPRFNFKFEKISDLRNVIQEFKNILN